MSKKEDQSKWLADWMEHNEYKSEYAERVRKYSEYIPNSTASLARMEIDVWLDDKKSDFNTFAYLQDEKVSGPVAL